MSFDPITYDAVSALREQLAGVAAELDEVKTSVEATEPRVTDVQTKAGDIQSKVTSVKATVEGMEDVLDGLDETARMALAPLTIPSARFVTMMSDPEMVAALISREGNLALALDNPAYASSLLNNEHLLRSQWAMRQVFKDRVLLSAFWNIREGDGSGYQRIYNVAEQHMTWVKTATSPSFRVDVVTLREAIDLTPYESFHALVSKPNAAEEDRYVAGARTTATGTNLTSWGADWAVTERTFDISDRSGEYPLVVGARTSSGGDIGDVTTIIYEAFWFS